MEKCLEIVKEVKKKKEKILIYTQWIKMIDLLDKMLIKENIQFKIFSGK